MKAVKLNEILQRNTTRSISRFEEPLAARYERTLRSEAGRAARRFKARVTQHSLVAAAPAPEAAMVAVYPDPEQAVALELPNGEPAEILHVTLAYLGEIAPDQAEAAAVIVREVAAAGEPLEGTIGGIASFGSETGVLAEIARVAELVRPDGGYGDAAYNSSTRSVYWVCADWTTDEEHDVALEAFLALPGVDAVEHEAETGLPEGEDWTPVYAGGRRLVEPSYPSIVLPDVPGLVELRVALCEALDAAGVPYSSSHGFVPHVTLAYTPEPTLPPKSLLGSPLSFDRLSLTRGDVPRDFELGRSLVAAGGPPDWTPPHPDEVFDAEAFVSTLHTKADSVRRKVIEELGKGLPIDWEVTNPLASAVLGRSAAKVTGIAETTRLNLMRTIRASYEQGLSVPDTAKAIQEGMLAAAPNRATVIARTELAAVANGGQLAIAETVAEAAGIAYMKRWLTAPGAKDPRHENYDGLDGQTVPLDGLFDVGGAMLDHPGDPDGEPEEVIQCRCAMEIVEPEDVPTETSTTDEPGSLETADVVPPEEPVAAFGFWSDLRAEMRGWSEDARRIAQDAISAHDDLGSTLLAIRSTESRELRAVANYTVGKEHLVVENLASGGKGGGTEMMRALAARAVAEGRGVELRAEGQARGFYQKIGMKPSGFNIYRFTEDEAREFVTRPPVPAAPALPAKPPEAMVAPTYAKAPVPKVPHLSEEEITSSSTDALWQAMATNGKIENLARADIASAETDRIATELWRRSELDLPPGTLRWDDVAGESHLHTTASDGHETVEKMAQEAIRRGETQMTVSDHAHLLTRDEIVAQHAEIDRLNAVYGDRFRIYKGIEANILRDGTLDVPDDLLATFDRVNASLHVEPEFQPTSRLVAATRNPYVTAIGHPHSIDADWDVLAKAAKEGKVALEVNGRDILRNGREAPAASMLAAAKRAGARVQIAGDAHRAGNLVDSRYAVRFAAKSGVTRDDLAKYQLRAPLEGKVTPPAGDTVSVSQKPFVPPAVVARVQELGLDGPVAEKGKLAQRLLGKSDDTRGMFQNAKGEWSAARAELHDRIYAAHFKGKAPPAGKPQAYFTAGGGASGKGGSTFLVEGKELTLAELDKRPDVVFIDPDRIKTMFPEFQRLEKADDPYAAAAVHEESSALGKAIAQRAFDEGYSVVLDSTGSGGAFLGKLETAAAKGYDVQVSMFSIPTNEAIVRGVARGDATGRYLPVSATKDAHRGASANLKVWKDSKSIGSWRVWDNTGANAKLIAEKQGGSVTIHDRKKWDATLAKADEHPILPAPQAEAPMVTLPDGRVVKDTVSVPGQAPIPPETLAKAKDYGVEKMGEIPRGPIAKRLLGDAKDTEELYRGPTGKYPPAREEIYKQAIAKTLEGHTPVPAGEREILVTAGGGASGKSLGLRVNPSLKPVDAVVVNPDEAMTFLPEWSQLSPAEPSAAAVLHEEGSYLSKRILEDALKGGYNILLDVVGDDEAGRFISKVHKVAELGEGYKVRLMMADAPTNVAIERNIGRASTETTHDYGRFVPIDVQKAQHRAAINRITDWWKDPMIDEWEIYRTEEVPGTLVARGGGGREPEIVDPEQWVSMMQKPWEEGPDGNPG